MHRIPVYFARLSTISYDNVPSAHAQILDLFAISSVPLILSLSSGNPVVILCLFSSVCFPAADHRVLEPAQNAGDCRLHGATLPLAVRGIDVHHQHVDSPCRAHGVLSVSTFAERRA